MKVGPLHVVTDETMGTMVRMMGELQAGASRALQQLSESRRSLARAEAELTAARAEAAELAARHEETLRTTAPVRYLHHTADANLPPSSVWPVDPDDLRSREAVRRIMAAYRKARQDHEAPSRGLWDHLTAIQAPFISALESGDEEAAGAALRRMFQTDLVWGLGYVAAEAAADALTPGGGLEIRYRVADMLLGLAEAVGSARMTNPEQSPAEYARPLAADPGATYARLRDSIGFDLHMPAVGGGYGCRLGGDLVSADTLYHAYAVHRLRQLGAGPGTRVAEIGGGYGCMALLAYRAGLTDYTIYDLPWVNALQGYFLIMGLPEGSVRLYGEPEGPLAVLPGWGFHRLPAASIDWAVNTNSLPEIGPETARRYVRDIARAVRVGFYSVNMESKTPVLDYGPQNCVAELAAEAGGLTRRCRQKYWMRAGYVEEVYAPESGLVNA